MLRPGSFRPAGRAGPASTSGTPDVTRQPLFWGALALASGIGIGRYAWRPATWWLATIVVFALAGYCLRRRVALSRVLILVALAVCGTLAEQTSSPSRPDAPWLGDGQEVTVTAHVIEEGNVEVEAPDSFRQRIDIETERIESETESREVRFGVRLSIYSKAGEGSLEAGSSNAGLHNSAMRLFHYGERMRFPATLNAPRNFRNPGAFDYAGYLREEGILATTSVKYPAITGLPGFDGTRAGAWFARAHRSVIQRIHHLWTGEAAGLIDAMLIGEKSFIERPARVDFQRSGTYHMLVVAGLHVGILAAFVLWILRRMGLGEVPASGVAMAAIFAYATLTREGSPVWRAALMFAAYLAARLLYRERAALNTIGMAALILLTSHPRALFAASFQMSFLCVGLLAGIGVPVLQRTLGPFERGLRNLDALACDRSVPPAVAQFRLDLRLIIRRLSLLLPGRVSGWLLVGGLRVLFGFSELVVLSAVMQIGMALPMAYYFHRATSVALVANLLAVPLLQLLMPAAVLAICVSYVSPGLAKVPAAIANFALDNIAGSVRWLGGMRIADIRLPAPSLAMVLFAGAAIATCIFCIRRRAWIAVGGAGCLLASTVLLWTVPPPEHFRSGALEMTAIDVGQGDSILLVLPDGNKLLVDAGGLPFWMHSQMDIGEDVVSAYLWARGFSRIDAIALTHAHGDHMGGFPAVIANFHPRELWLPENVVEEEARPLLAVAARYGVRLIYRGAGETFPYGGARIRILAPDPQFPIRSGHRNDESLVMQVEHGDTSVLLEADAEKGTERLVASHHPRADVLKVAHHGSASATNTDLLEAVRPRYAVISAGTRNVYRHPRPEVLQRLQDAGALTYRTDLDGATTFYLDGKRVTVENFRPH